MKKVLIINGHQYYDVVAKGELTRSYIDRATKFFLENGFEVKHTEIEKSYNIEEECQKFEWADAVLLQYPVYWMGVPWITKKYFDETFTQGRHYESDGRSRSDVSKTYGSGGLLKGKKYMLSITYNCPTTEFSNPKSFFDGLSLDEANVATHKTFQFVGFEPLKTYSVHDIFKGDLDLTKELEKFENTLKENFLQK
ncbi:NAD(P)H-dependent oxidoreductase [Aliarcobacter cibarius]|uniref:NAD(P)H-dependent oxidoreductase n=1 Tax=Aliarcobacter cibarius TaxID=255507 RepID=UPI0010FD063E|nr:NAD(P)H-dependent oxidoreductase [Aliarcobacter cibarius]TLT02567.1 NAD(P)H-dependent oxidoreductase [Aliarcobacter cibarius]